MREDPSWSNDPPPRWPNNDDGNWGTPQQPPYPPRSDNPTDAFRPSGPVSPQRSYEPAPNPYGPPPNPYDAAAPRAGAYRAPDYAEDGQAAPRRAYRAQQAAHPPIRRLIPSINFPLEHIILAAGIFALFASLTQPWGLDAHGNAIKLNDITIKGAYIVIGANAVLAALLILLKQRLGCLTFSGCLMLFAIPLVLAMALGGVEFFTQIHILPAITQTELLRDTNRGLVLWWGGMAAIVLGLLLEFVTHHKKGLIGLP